MSTRHSRLEVEELDARITPSSFRSTFPGFPGFPSDPVTISPPVTGNTVTGNVSHHAGEGNGTYTVASVENAPGPRMNITGTGRLGGVGNVSIIGFIHEVGPRRGEAGGHLALSNHHGMLVLQLTGPEQRAGHPLPETMGYRIIGGTGAYHHLSGHGILHILLTPNADGTGGTYTIRFN